VRVLITRKRDEEIDGIDLRSFQVGFSYEVSPSLATYLLTTRSAEPVGDDRAQLAGTAGVRTGLGVQRWREVADDSGRAPRNAAKPVDLGTPPTDESR